MKKTLLALIFSLCPGLVSAEIVIGVSTSSTGQGASLGIPITNAITLLPTTVAGKQVRYVVMDDTGDPTTGARNVRKMVSEDNADVIIGSNMVPVAIAQSSIASESKTPLIAISPIPTHDQPYVFAVPQPISLMVDALLDHMQANGVKKLAYIGFSDSWGDMNYRFAANGSEQRGISLTTNERYNRNDTSVNSQILKVMASKPDAIFIGGSGTAAALPQLTAVDRGYQGFIYHTHGVVNHDFIRLAGDAGKAAIAPTGPVTIAEQLPDDHPLKANGLEFLKKYEGKYGTGSRNAFAAYAWDASLLIQEAIPVALKTSAPGTPEFRQALRDALESNQEVRGTHAVYSMQPNDHSGVDERARVLVKVEKGEWRLLD